MHAYYLASDTKKYSSAEQKLNKQKQKSAMASRKICKKAKTEKVESGKCS